MSHEYEYIRIAFKAFNRCKKAYELYCDFREVKSLVDEHAGTDFRKNKYSNFVNKLIQRIVHLETKLEIRTLERDQVIESKARLRFNFLISSGLACIGFFIFGYLSQFIPL